MGNEGSMSCCNYISCNYVSILEGNPNGSAYWEIFILEEVLDCPFL